MVRVRRGDVDYVNVRVGDQLGVGAVGFGFAGCADIVQEVGGSGGGRGGGCCCYDVMDIGYFAGGGVGDEVFGECWRESVGFIGRRRIGCTGCYSTCC